MKTMMVRGSPVIRPLLAAAAIVIVVFGLKYSSDVLAPIFLAATLAILFTPAFWWLRKERIAPLDGAGGNGACSWRFMDNAVTPRIYGKGLNLPVLLVFTSFLFWSWVFGFVGVLLAISATLFVKALLQGARRCASWSFYSAGRMKVM